MPREFQGKIELDIRAGVHGWKSTIPSFAEWWAVYRKTYTPVKSAKNRDAQIVAHFLPHVLSALDRGSVGRSADRDTKPQQPPA